MALSVTGFSRGFLRELLELAAIAGAAAGILWLRPLLPPPWREQLVWLVVAVCLLKTVYFVGETLWHLRQAVRSDLPYHRFVILMAYNMAEITLSFAVDFGCLVWVNPHSLSGIDPGMTGPAVLFECFYFSVLNFSYFGYGDITPAIVPAKIVMLTEVITAFSTVLFLLSDFIAMKESIRGRAS